MAKILGQSKVYSNYRVSIAEIKELLKIEEGDRIIFVKEGDKIEIRKMKP